MVRKLRLILIIFALVIASTLAMALSKKNLVGIEWGPEKGDLGLYLKFKANGKYTIEMQGPGGMNCSGKYQVSGGKVILKQGGKDHNGSVDCSPKTCTLKKTTESLYYNSYLQCGSDKFYGADRVSKGKKMKIGKIQAIKVGDSGITTDKVRMRKGPSTKSKKNFCEMHEGPDAGKKFSVLPKDTEVTIVARTEKKSKIGKWKNYWYYVMYDFDAEMLSCKSGEFWLYGEFVKIK